MRVRHPISFSLMLIVIASTAALSVVWSFAHMIAVGINIGAIVLLRWVAFREGHGWSMWPFRRVS